MQTGIGGLVLGAHVHVASLRDRDGSQRLPTDDPKEAPPRLELAWADGAYTKGFREWAEKERGWRVEVPHHPDRQPWRHGLEEKPRGFLVPPKRWVVQRTFAWLGQARQPAKDYERPREAAGDRGGDDPLGHESHHAPWASQSGSLRCFEKGKERPGGALQNSFREHG